MTHVGALDAAGYLRYGATHHAMPVSTSFQPTVSEPTQPALPPATPNHFFNHDIRESETPQDEGFDVWDYSLRGKTVILKTPKDIPLALWQKLVNYLQVIKPEPEEDGP